VRTILVEKPDVLRADVAEMAQAEAQEIVETLSLKGPYPRLDERVRIWCEQRCSQWSGAPTTEKFSKGGREFAVAIMQEESRPKLLLVEPHQSITALLLDPFVVWAVGRRAEKDLSRADVDEGEAVRKPHAQGRDHALGEEIGDSSDEVAVFTSSGLAIGLCLLIFVGVAGSGGQVMDHTESDSSGDGLASSGSVDGLLTLAVSSVFAFDGIVGRSEVRVFEELQGLVEVG